MHACMYTHTHTHTLTHKYCAYITLTHVIHVHTYLYMVREREGEREREREQAPPRGAKWTAASRQTRHSASESPGRLASGTPGTRSSSAARRKRERADRPRPPPAAGSTHLTCSVVCIPRNHPSQICCRPSLLRRAQSLSRGVHRAGPAGHDDGRSPARADASHASAGLSATRPDHAKTAPHPSAPHVLGR